jgi:hypothetical protein
MSSPFANVTTQKGDTLMKKSLAACTLAVALALCLAGSAWAAAPNPAPSQVPAAVAGAQAAPSAVKPVSLPAFLNQLAPAAPPKDGAQIGTPEPEYKTCPGFAYCRNFCTSNGGPNCLPVYKCLVNGSWSCTCQGPGGGFCD